MPNSDLLPSLLFKLNDNQLALEAAILKLTNWVQQRGSGEVAEECTRGSGHHRPQRRIYQNDARRSHDA